MMIHAYQEKYLSNVETILAEAFDYAINNCDIEGEHFIKLFISSKLCKCIEEGNTSYLIGKSGIELVLDFLSDANYDVSFNRYQISYRRSCEYWIGSVLAYYQWYSNRSFEDIFTVLPLSDLRVMYNALHESDISKFVLIADKKIKETFTDTNLKRIRLLYGISQSQLAKQSGVSLRSIQMYEQRNKNINKASGETLYRLSKTLGCLVESLLEF